MNIEVASDGQWYSSRTWCISRRTYDAVFCLGFGTIQESYNAQIRQAAEKEA
jgi:hypothetical protein